VYLGSEKPDETFAFKIRPNAVLNGCA